MTSPHSPPSSPQPQHLLSLAQWDAAARSALVGVFTDIDDTLTTEGAITPDALQAMDALHAAGLNLVAITGRPVGWSEPFAGVWPVDAIVAENGAVALVRTAEGRIEKRYQQDAATRARNFERMQAVLARIEREIPAARRATDSAGRECDIAIDHSEFTQLDDATIAQVAGLMRSEGMHATVSSIHVNGWWGDHNKLEGARWIVRELWGRSLDDETQRWAYVGDSTNDALMFEHFAHSVGVANVRRFEAALSHLPRYVAPSERGAGFAEVAAAILRARRAGSIDPNIRPDV
ncbi:HAD family hydrolase [Variovorax sp. WS11]|uniref:HAD-IIB family hydrolase n=1 Tax=Variovorax sp. WS11 TaxID=1105204 RepID=UPI000D0CA5BE|nr:HAD-IIB family hydrolase [Variovorax sp. WS11]NDZ12913.1 HAD-IIB family hydrolase [Variovorax sp. WS11]PSL82828.1 HAD family hydrolase [Variovorax sp. WS11]